MYRKRQVLDHCSQFERPPQRAQYCRYQTYSDALNFRSLDRERERERETDRQTDRQTDRDRLTDQWVGRVGEEVGVG